MTVDLGTISAIARDLGANEVKQRNGKITCTCLMARWTHYGGRDSKPSMVIFPSGKRGDPIYKCMGCHEEGSLRELVLDHWVATGRNLMHWIMLLDGEEGSRPPVKQSARVMAWPDEPGILKKSAVAEAPEVVKSFKNGKPFYDYKLIAEADKVKAIDESVLAPYAIGVPAFAIKRGLTIETCKEWGLGHDKASKRLLFPIRDRSGKLVAISGRSYATDCVECNGKIIRGTFDEDGTKVRPYCEKCGEFEKPKYLHSFGFKRNLVLYGEHRKEDNVDGNVFLVEGHLDMLRMWQHGYRPVVAMLGSYPGNCQIEKLISYWGRLITIVPDGDKAGLDMAAKVKQLVADRIKVISKKLPDGSDPGSLTKEQLREFVGEPTVAIGD